MRDCFQDGFKACFNRALRECMVVGGREGETGVQRNVPGFMHIGKDTGADFGTNRFRFSKAFSSTPRSEALWEGPCFQNGFIVALGKGA